MFGFIVALSANIAVGLADSMNTNRKAREHATRREKRLAEYRALEAEIRRREIENRIFCDYVIAQQRRK